jgi:ADP-ribose pyrophosphatase YjhB (NUDIX family)
MSVGVARMSAPTAAMPKPITPLVGCDVFVVDAANRVLLVKRSDNGRWALPGGCQDLGETPAECAVREVREETGYDIRITRLLGVFSSTCYEYVHYPWKENEFTHVCFAAAIVGGAPTPSPETPEVGFFAEAGLPPMSDGHERRVRVGFAAARDPEFRAMFE